MLTLRLDGLPGSDIEECAGELIRLAKLLQVITELKFNGTLMWAYPIDNLDEVVGRFKQMYK